MSETDRKRWYGMGMNEDKFEARVGALFAMLAAQYTDTLDALFYWSTDRWTRAQVAEAYGKLAATATSMRDHFAQEVQL